MKIEKIDIRRVDPSQATTHAAYQQAYRDFRKSARVYIFPKDETIWENLENRHQRPHTTFRKEVMPAVLAAMNLPANTRIRWSQYAGCSCPCSPGFIIDEVKGTSVYVDVIL